MVADPYIHTGYRINYLTKTQANWSIVELHNETFNIWSHLFGALIFLYIAVFISTYLQPPEVKVNMACHPDCKQNELFVAPEQ